MIWREIDRAPELRRRWSPWRKRGAPLTRRRFVHDWDRLAYLYTKAHYWLRVARRRRNAARYIAPLEALVGLLERGAGEATVFWSSRAILAEFRDDVRAAIHASERVVVSLELLRAAWPDCRDVSASDLTNEMRALAALRFLLLTLT